MGRQAGDTNEGWHRYGEAAEKRQYNGTRDAERVLETTMCRANWSHAVRDELKEELETIVAKRGGR